MASSKSNAPIKRFKLGYVESSVWLNESGYHSVTVSRSYKDGDGNWQNSDSFGAGDLLNLIRTLERAELFIANGD